MKKILHSSKQKGEIRLLLEQGLIKTRCVGFWEMAVCELDF